jgi:hypothetical protein
MVEGGLAWPHAGVFRSSLRTLLLHSRVPAILPAATPPSTTTSLSRCSYHLSTGLRRVGAVGCTCFYS